MRTEVKFCGLTRAEDARAAAELGAGYVGVVLADGPRRLTPERAASVLDGAGQGASRAGVFGACGTADIVAASRAARLDVVQLHGDPAPEDVERVHAVTGARVWAVIRVRRHDVEALRARVASLDGLADAIVLDAFVEGQLGGTGTPFDWTLVDETTRPKHARLVLAGGLAPENVGHAVAALAPDVVDVSSGVEERPGIKSRDRMRAFVEAVRAHEGPR